MAQPSQVVPTVKLNVSGAKQQVNLRDYLNVRIAPFLKKAIHESLDAEAEFPLQWLGEYLIQQSIMFEGNPDTNNIRERFLYKHDEARNGVAGADGHTGQTSSADAQQTPLPHQPAVNGAGVLPGEQAVSDAPQTYDQTAAAASVEGVTSIPAEIGHVIPTAGAVAVEGEEGGEETDTIMGGTS